MHIVGRSSNCSLWRCVTACLEEFSSMVCPNGSPHGRKFPLECDGLGESMMQLFFFKDATACYPWNHVYGFLHESYVMWSQGCNPHGILLCTLPLQNPLWGMLGKPPEDVVHSLFFWCALVMEIFYGTSLLNGLNVASHAAFLLSFSPACCVDLPKDVARPLNASSPHINQDATFKISSNLLSIYLCACFLKEDFQ